MEMPGCEITGPEDPARTAGRWRLRPAGGGRNRMLLHPHRSPDANSNHIFQDRSTEIYRSSRSADDLGAGGAPRRSPPGVHTWISSSGQDPACGRSAARLFLALRGRGSGPGDRGGTWESTGAPSDGNAWGRASYEGGDGRWSV